MLEVNQSYVKGQEWLFDTATSTHFLKDRGLSPMYKTVSSTDMSVVIGVIKYPVAKFDTSKHHVHA